MKIKYNILLIILFITSARALCQAQEPTQSAFYNNIIPPSPNGATFQRYGDYPVSLSTGLPEISIPIYDIKEGSLSFPVTLSYHASGRNMSMSLSPLGIGWALNASGIISRTVRGRADLLPYQAPPYNIDISTISKGALDSALAEMAPNSSLMGLSPNTRESQHDVFSFNVNGKTGKFIIDSGRVIMLSGEPYRVQVLSADYLKITDEQGIQYLFGWELGDTCGGTESSVDQGGMPYNSSWMLNTITTPTGQLIKFKYGNVQSTSFGTSPIVGNINISDQYSIVDNELGIQPPNADNLIFKSSALSAQDYSMCYTKEIDFDNGSLYFNYDDSLKLLSCRVQDKLDRLVKSDTLLYSDLPDEDLPNNNSVLLDSLFEMDNIGNAIQKYGFEYNLNNIPSTVGEGWDMIKHTDWWGYFNDAISGDLTHFNVDIISASGIKNYESIGTASAKEPSYNAKIYATLKKITYPTGGTTQFILEPNKYLNNSGIPCIGPGLRVQQILSSDGLGNTLTKLYKYGLDESGYGTLLSYPDTTHFMSQNIIFAYNESADVGWWRSRVFSSNLNPIFSEEYSYPEYYQQVTEYQTASNNNANNGKTITYYQLPQMTRYYIVSPSGSVVNGITLDHINFNQLLFLPSTEALLTKKEIYNIANNTYNLVAEDNYTYGQYNSLNTKDVFMNVLTRYTDQTNEYDTMMLRMGFPVYLYSHDGSILSVSQRINTHQHIDYVNGQAKTTTINYQYANSDYPFPTSIQSIDSKGGLVTTTLKYPLDYQHITATDTVSVGINNLINLHIIAPTIEKSIYHSNADGSNKALISSVFTAFKSVTPLPDYISSMDITNPLTNFIPSFVSSGAIVKDSRYTQKMLFNQYDNYGNILERQKANGCKEAYIWGYNSQYPVAKIVGSSYNAAIGFVNQTMLNNATSLTDDNQIRTELNKLRTGLSKALVYSYTYKPLIGMTSGTDSKGDNLYYDYDGFGRLIDVKDDKRNIVKRILYNYNGGNNNLTDDTPVYTNADETGLFTRNDCDTGFVGSTVRYTVPKGSFISTISSIDAQQQAINTVAAYGQQYANIKGACSVPVITTTVQLSYNISSVISNTPVSLTFQGPLGSYSTTQTSSFPRGAGPYNTVTLPVGNYTLQFTLPSAYSGHFITFTLNPFCRFNC